MEPPASLHRSEGCEIELGPVNLRANVGPGLAQQIQACYRAVVNECLNRRCTRVLIVGVSNGDAFNHLALRDALRSMSVAGLPPDFRLAVVAGTPDLIAVFDAAVVEAGRCSIDARRLLTVAEAEGWLAV